MMVSQALDTLTNMSATAKLQQLENLHIAQKTWPRSKMDCVMGKQLRNKLFDSLVLIHNLDVLTVN